MQVGSVIIARKIAWEIKRAGGIPRTIVVEDRDPETNMAKNYYIVERIE